MEIRERRKSVICPVCQKELPEGMYAHEECVEREKQRAEAIYKEYVDNMTEATGTPIDYTSGDTDLQEAGRGMAVGYAEGKLLEEFEQIIPEGRKVILEKLSSDGESAMVKDLIEFAKENNLRIS